MKLIVGLGNPGEKYENSRHNLGFLALDDLLKKYEPVKETFWEDEKKLKSQIKIVKHGGTNLILAKPTTFMNLSGTAVEKILSYYKIDPKNMIVVYDELDLPFGKLRIRFGGGAGGHHGVESIINSINDDKFLRIRLGIGSEARTDKPRSKNKDEVSDYVLSSFQSKEKGKIKSMLKQVTKDVDLILSHGIDTYMSKYNK